MGGFVIAAAERLDAMPGVAAEDVADEVMLFIVDIRKERQRFNL